MNKDNIETDIQEFIEKMELKYNLFQYCSNQKKQEFNPEKDWVYYSGPHWDNKEKVALLKTAMSGRWLSSGESVYKFEKDFSKLFNMDYTVMVNSGSSANLIMISALKQYYSWEENDEIILSPVGFPTTLTPIIQNNLKPVFIDIKWEDLNFDLKLIEQKITEKTRSIILSPVLGNPPNMDSLIDLANKYKLELILDNCDSLGSKWKGNYLSDYCIASSCSFYPAHHITTGQGGTVSTNNVKISQIVRSLSSWGGDCVCVGSANLLPNGSCGTRFSRWIDGFDGIVDHRYLFTNIGYNLKPLDLQGAIGVQQLKKFDEIHRIRRKNKEIIQLAIEKNINGVRVLREHAKAETSWFGVGIICDTQKLKEELVSYFEKNRIQTRNYFAGNLLLHPAFKELDESNNYSVSNKVLGQVFFLGCSPVIKKEMINYIIKVINDYINE